MVLMNNKNIRTHYKHIQMSLFTALHFVIKPTYPSFPLLCVCMSSSIPSCFLNLSQSSLDFSRVLNLFFLPSWPTRAAKPPPPPLPLPRPAKTPPLPLPAVGAGTSFSTLQKQPQLLQDKSYHQYK